MGALAFPARSREVLLPVLLLPTLLPLLVAAVGATAGVMAGQTMTEIAPNLTLVAGYAVVYLTLGFLLYPILLESAS